MEYQNPKLPENINVTRHHPLKTFFKLLAMAALLAVIVIVGLNVTAQYVAKYVPFKFETAIASQFELVESDPSEEQVYLQALADKILAKSDADEDIKITVHYSDEDVVNAFATLGGHVYFYKGLVEKLKSEQALAMVMGHEIAHVVNRDPITALGRGLSTAIALSAIFGSSDNALIRRFVGSGELLTSLKYSRDHEHQADEDGFNWIHKLYGHACGAEDLFELFENMQSDDDNFIPQILTTHPYASKRLERIKDKQTSQCDSSAIEVTANPLYRKG